MFLIALYYSNYTIQRVLLQLLHSVLYFQILYLVLYLPYPSMTMMICWYAEVKLERIRSIIGETYSIPSSSPATAHNQEFWAQAKTRCKLGTYQISYILSSTILVPSRNKCVELIIDHILTSLCLLSKCKMCRINSWHSPKI